MSGLTTLFSRRFLRAAAGPALLLFLTACSASRPNPASGSKAGKGFRVLDAVVTGRTYDPPGSRGTTLGGSGTYFLEFEAKDGEATAHYRFPVTRNQYNRYAEGSRVQLVMADDQLRDIRPVP
jgi:hypothetical protein